MSKEIKEEFFNILEDVEKDINLEPLKKAPHHFVMTRYEHCAGVAYASFMIAKKLKLNINFRSLIRGGLLHDYYFYNWHDKKQRPKHHGKEHPKIALANAQKEVPDLNDTEKEIIRCHMFPMNLKEAPQSEEARLVSIVDKISALYELINKKSIQTASLAMLFVCTVLFL